MIASKSLRRIWILGFEIVACVVIGVIASNALAAQATLAWDPNTESDLAGYRIHHGTASGSYTVHTDVHNVTSYTVTGLTAGQTYYFAATAYDASGNESGYSNPVSYSVPAGTNVAPAAPGTPSGPSNVLINVAATFSTSAIDPNGDSLQYRYDWGGGVLSNWGTASQSNSWAAAGQYTVKAQARDSIGAESAWSGANTVTVIQSTQNAAPSTPATPSGASSALVNAAITFSTSATDPNGDNLQYRYDWGGGLLSNWGAASQSHSWAAAGQYTVKAQAQDSLGAESAWSTAKTVSIGNAATASNGAPVRPTTPSGPSSVLVNVPATFSTSATDPNGNILQYRYDWGGGVLSIWGAASQSHSWAAAGQYTVRAQARDSLGAESAWSRAKTVTIQTVNAGQVQSPDTDGDGVPDSQDAFPNDPKEWADANGNGTGDNAEGAADQSNLPPDAPLLTSPVKDSVVSAMTELQTGPFNSPAAGTTHGQTRWQLFRDEDDACVLDIQSPAALTSFTVPKLVLDEGTPFFWRAQFIDSKGVASAWSDYEYFSTQTTETDLNANGIPDAQEVPSMADLDRDGVPDSQQTAIKSVKMEGTTVQTGVSIMETPAALAIESVESEDPRQPELYPNSKPQNMPFGILNIKIAVANPGDQAVVKLYFLEPVPATGKWYEYDPAADRWIDFSAYTEFANDRMSATLTLRDGGVGDSDGVANGVIIDPGGIGVADNAPASGSAPQGGSGGGAGCFIGAINDAGRHEFMISTLCLLGSLSLLAHCALKR